MTVFFRKIARCFQTLFRKIGNRFLLIRFLVKNMGSPAVGSSVFGQRIIGFDLVSPEELFGDPSFPPRLNQLFRGLDADSCLEIRRALRHHIFGQELNRNSYILKLEIPPYKQNDYRAFEAERARWKHCGLRYLPPESLYYHHGLRTAPEEVKRYLAGTVFVDGGSCYGDSILALQQYAPSRILAFDISPANAARFHEIMKQNRIPPEWSELHLNGLGEREDILSFRDGMEGGTGAAHPGKTQARILPLDSVTASVSGRVGLIKMDLEGAALSALRGAEKTIRRDRPVLAIAVYHSREELFGVKAFLENLDLHYHFSFRSCGFYDGYELTLLVWPEELCP